MDLFREILEAGAEGDLMLVGHEPDQTRMISEILRKGSGLEIELKKSGACGLEVDGMPPKKPGKLLWLLTPKQLAQIKRP